MDSLAKAFWSEHVSNQPQDLYNIQDSGWSIWCGRRKLTHCDKKTIYEHVHKAEILQHWTKRNRFPADMINNINWSASADAMKKLGIHRARWACKYVSGYIGVGTTLHKWKLQATPQCPRCEEDETTAHVVQCQAPAADARWQASLKELEIWMRRQHTMPDIATAILSRMMQWRNNEPFTPPTYDWPGLNTLVLRQDSIGWQPFIEGCTDIEWEAKQQDYYSWLERRNTGKRWISSLIKKVWSIAWDMWQHRNQVKHAPQSEHFLQAQAALDICLRKEYATGWERLLRKDYRWFRRDIELLLVESNEWKHKWIASVTQARLRATRVNPHTATNATNSDSGFTKSPPTTSKPRHISVYIQHHAGNRPVTDPCHSF